MRFNAQRDAGGARTAGKRERQHWPYFAEETQRVNPGKRHNHAVNHEHQRQADVGHHHKAAEFDDVLQVGHGDHFGHQGQHAVRGELHHQTHQTHHPGLQGVDGVKHFAAFFRLVLEQLQRSNPQERGKDHHADDRRRLGTGQVSKRVLRDERQQQLRHIQVGHFTGVIALDDLQAAHFSCARHQAVSREAEQVGQADADQRCNHGGEQQGADGQKADLAQRRCVVQARDRAEDRSKDQRNHDHLQQLHIAAADQIEPADRGFQGWAFCTVDQVQTKTKHHTDNQRQQDFFRQAPRGVAGQRQAEQQREEHQQIEDQRVIHESSGGATCTSLGL